MINSDPPHLLVGVVGPCGSGKSTLIGSLEHLGFRCRHIAQEHSYVPHMWQAITNPDLLVYLAASFATCTTRRNLNWSEADYTEQIHRLRHARQHADLIIETDGLSPQQVVAAVLAFLGRHAGVGGTAEA